MARKRAATVKRPAAAQDGHSSRRSERRRPREQVMAVPPATAGGAGASPVQAAGPAAAFLTQSAGDPATALRPPAGTSAGRSTGTAGSRDVTVNMTVVCGDLTQVEAPVAANAHYEGLAPAGQTKLFDEILDLWVTRALDFGLIGLRLGQVYPIDLTRARASGKAKADRLLLAGMGEPGGFAADDLRYLISNITVAVKSMRQDTLATSLFGTRRDELPVEQALRAFLSGIMDGYERFRAMADVVRDDPEFFRKAAFDPLNVYLAEPDKRKCEEIRWVLETKRIRCPDLTLTVQFAEGSRSCSGAENSPTDAEPYMRAAYLRATVKTSSNAQSTSQPDSAARGQTMPFEFSALSEVAAAPVRQQDINAYLIGMIPERLTTTPKPELRERLGRFFADVMIPDDFRKLTEGAMALTLELDETTAMYPWEMMAHKKYSRTSFIGTSVSVSRQFRSLLAPRPSSPPPLNASLRVLVIADPASGKLSLPGARDEGFAVLEILEEAQEAWRGTYDISATVRIGGKDLTSDARLAEWLERSKARENWIDSVEACDPLDIAMLIVSEQYDVIHYAGHGFADSQTGRTGWILDEHCCLSAQEIFRVRKVPRLVFANACFSALTGEDQDLDVITQRKRLVGMAQAFFARGIPNFIGAGWKVDDECARVCARRFYAAALGLDDSGGGGRSASGPLPISAALFNARSDTFDFRKELATWGAYQHYGRVADKLLQSAQHDGTARSAKEEPSYRAPPPSPGAGQARPSQDASATAANPAAPKAEDPPHAAAAPATAPAAIASAPAPAIDPNLVYVNGIDFETGAYAVPPRSIDELARDVRQRPHDRSIVDLSGGDLTRFALPFRIEFDKFDETGWGVVFHEDTPANVRAALAPLVDRRKNLAGTRFKELDYRKGERTRDWYQRWGISPGNMQTRIVPYYLLLIGPPDLIPFDFQYLLGIEYAVGRLSFDTAAEYALYAQSVVDYETAGAVPTTKEITYWGTRHLGDGATNMSASLLVDPLANGVPDDAGDLKTPIGSETGYGQKLLLGGDATKGNLLAVLHADRPSALLFTASHGMSLRSGLPNQTSDQGSLLCQDWPGYGSIRPQHLLTAKDVGDDANVHGLVAFMFACFGAGTPVNDQFATDLAQAGQLPPLAPNPFVAALPRRLLAHPKGGALAVIGHVDRAWGFSIQAAKSTGPQIGSFRNSLGDILTGAPVGHALTQTFGAKFAELSAILLSAISPTGSTADKPSDRELVTYWIERNDAQNYVMLGDPAARIQADKLA